MARENHYTFVANDAGKQMITERGLFQAGGTQTIFKGELLAHDGTRFVPLLANQAMSATVAIALQEVAVGDDAGYRDVQLPQEGDVFECDLLSTDSQTPVTGARLDVSAANSDAHTVTTTNGANQLGTVVGQQHYPQAQGRQSQDASFDRGVAIGKLPGGKVRFSILKAASRLAALWE